MSKVNTSAHIPVSAEKIWELIGQFNGLPGWHPAAESSELEDGGQQRRIQIAGGGGEIVEKLLKLDDNNYEYSYSIVDSPLPVADYVSTLKVVPDEDGEGCTIEWGGTFEAAGAPVEKAEEIVMGIYKSGLKNLSKMFG